MEFVGFRVPGGGRGGGGGRDRPKNHGSNFSRISRKILFEANNPVALPGQLLNEKFFVVCAGDVARFGHQSRVSMVANPALWQGT